jgi:hypothetical protein
MGRIWGASSVSVTTYPAATAAALPPGARVVNDVHSQLNRTWVRGVETPASLEDLQATVRRARARDASLCVAGGQHAMGGQQFGTGAVLVDMSSMRRVLRFDPDRREIEVEAGIQWPELIAFTARAQAGRRDQVGIIQKQTGADRLSLGGALASNVHGRGLRLGPIVGDVESFVLVDARGEARRCSRSENADLFRLAIGGYGLFGVVASVTLRLAPRRKLERVVQLVDLADLMPAFERRIAEGCLYGDFQYVTDPASEGFLTSGILSCYRPVPDDTPIPEAQAELSPSDWRELYYLAHTDRASAYEVYSGHYLSTSGQVYWSDTHQLSVYLDDYHGELDRRVGAAVPATEMISELYVPRPALAGFMAAVREDFLRNRPELIYGTVRLIERDEETFLAWAKEPYACVIFNLHVPHSASGVAGAKADFRRLIGRAVERGGSFFLTYHRWATREQVEACYPRFGEFLRLKRERDPGELFQSDWYRHYRGMFEGRG